MLNKTGKTPKSYAENLLNSDGTVFACFNCDKIIRNVKDKPEKCPFCESEKIGSYVPKNINESCDDAGKDNGKTKN